MGGLLITHPAAPDPLWGNGRRWLEWTILYLPSSFQSSNHKLISAGLGPKSRIWELQSAWRRAQSPRRVHGNSKVVPWLGGTLDAGLERWPTGVPGVPLFWSGAAQRDVPSRLGTIPRERDPSAVTRVRASRDPPKPRPLPQVGPPHQPIWKKPGCGRRGFPDRKWRLCLAGRGVRRSSRQRLRRLSGKWLGFLRLWRLGLWWRQRLRQREVRNSRCGGGRNRGPCSLKALKGPWVLDGRVSCRGPKSPGCPLLTLHPVLLALPQSDSPLPGPCFHPGRCQLPLRRCPHPTRTLLSGVVGWGLLGVSIVRKGKGKPPPCSRDRAGAAVAGSILWSNCWIVPSACVALLSCEPSPAPSPLLFASLSHLRLWGLQILFLLHPPHLPGYFFFFFAANPLASGRQYYFCVYLAHHLSGRAVRLKIFASSWVTEEQ